MERNSKHYNYRYESEAHNMYAYYQWFAMAFNRDYVKHRTKLYLDRLNEHYKLEWNLLRDISNSGVEDASGKAFWIEADDCECLIFK